MELWLAVRCSSTATPFHPLRHRPWPQSSSSNEDQPTDEHAYPDHPMRAPLPKQRRTEENSTVRLVTRSFLQPSELPDLRATVKEMTRIERGVTVSVGIRQGDINATKEKEPENANLPGFWHARRVCERSAMVVEFCSKI